LGFRLLWQSLSGFPYTGGRNMFRLRQSLALLFCLFF
jgi:hypothetical protein